MAATLLVWKSFTSPRPLPAWLPHILLIADAGVTLTLSVCLQLASRWHSNLFPPFLRVMQLTSPFPVPLEWLQKCLIGSGHNFSIRINYVRRQRKMLQVQPGDFADKCDFQSWPLALSRPLFLCLPSTQLEALTGLAIITPIITAILYSLPREWGQASTEETENEEICEFNLWLHCHEQNWVSARPSLSLWLSRTQVQ